MFHQCTFSPSVAITSHLVMTLVDTMPLIRIQVGCGGHDGVGVVKENVGGEGVPIP